MLRACVASVRACLRACVGSHVLGFANHMGDINTELTNDRMQIAARSFSAYEQEVDL